MELQIVECDACGMRNRVPSAAVGIPGCGSCQARLPWLTSATEVDFHEVVEVGSLPVVVDLWAPWCGPCRRLNPALERLAREQAGRMKLVKVNVDDSPGVAVRFGVQTIPTLLVVWQGREVARRVGAPSGMTLRAWVEHVLASASG